MGQSFSAGKARINKGAIPFVNLPKSLIEALSQSVYEVAEGFEINQDELKQIVQVTLHEYFVRHSDSSLDECSQALFALFAGGATSDSDDTLIDSFEFLATTCLASGMEMDEKVDFLFHLFDINEAGRLNINEATLAFRSLATGATKIASRSGSIDIDVIDNVAVEGFELSMPDSLKHSHAMEVEGHNLSKKDFFDYVVNCAETLSLLSHFGDIAVEEAGIDQELLKLKPLRFQVPAVDKTPACEPWRDQLRFLKPDGGEEASRSPPTDGLQLNYVYGRNARTPAVYCSNGDAMFAAGSTVVKVSTDDDGNAIQEYFFGHSGHVTSLDVFNAGGSLGDVVASGDASSEANICVWSSETLSSIVTIPCFHPSGTSKLQFSPSGELLLSLGNCDQNSIAIYNWKEKRVVYTSMAPGFEVYDCSFLASDNSFGVCANDSVHFWTRLQPSSPYTRHRGVFNRLSTKEAMTSITCVGGKVVTGSLLGRLWLWEGRVCTKLVETLRSGPVTQLHAPRNGADGGLCVATHGGTVLLLNTDLVIQHRLAPNKGFSDSELVIDAVCWHPELEKILVGQNGNSLYELGVCKEGVQMLTAGHHDIAGMALCSHNIVTVGRDRIKMWDATNHRVVRESLVEAAQSREVTLSCVSHNPREGQIAVGFATDDTRSSLDHSFVILNGIDLQIIHRGCNSLESLTVCSHTNDGKLLAFGSADASIYIHKCTEKEFTLLAKLRGHTSPISSIDFGCERGSDSAAFLRSNSVGGEAMFWTTRGKTQTPLSQRDTVWESQSCIYRPSLEGAHNSCDEQARITSCCPLSNKEGESVIVGDSSGNLRIHSHPATFSQPKFLEYRGHSRSVQSIQVSPDQKTVYTRSGGGDSCVFQWKRKTDTHWERGLPCVRLRSKPLSSLANNESSPDMNTMIAQMDTLDFSNDDTKDSSVPKLPKPRPWSRSIVAPSKFTPNVGPLPGSQLILERVHGYSGGARSNLHRLSDGSIVYSTGKMLIRYNVEEDKQEFSAASSEITCLAVHLGESICAIGLETASPAIIVVDVKTMKPLSFLNGGAGGVLCLDIDDSAKLVVSIGSNQEILVHDWKGGVLTSSSRTYGQETLDISFLKGSSNRFVECGVCFVRFWCIKGCSLSFEEVEMDSLANHTQYYGCLGWNNGELVVGTSGGDLIQFLNNKPDQRRTKAHQAAVTNISHAKDGFISSTVDCFKVWSSNMRCMLSINTDAIGTKHALSSICWAKDTIFVGTNGSEIWEVSSEDGTNLNRNGKSLISSHSSSPTGLSIHPNGTFATCGDDGFLRVWSSFDHQESISIDLSTSVGACAFSPEANGRMIAVGFGKPSEKSTVDGKWIILNLSSSADGEFQIIAERRDVRKSITEMKWHSQGDRLAVGSLDKTVCVYGLETATKPAVSVDITLLSKIDLASAPMHFDFSRDGKYLRANLESHELHFFEAGPGIHIKEPSRLKDTHWETETCVYSWNVQGVWQRETPDIVSLDCSVQDCPSIVSGDIGGSLRLHQFPAASTSAQYIAYPAHRGPVAKVRWVPGGYVVSTGEADQAVMIWRQEVDEGYLMDASPAGQMGASTALNSSDVIASRSTALYDVVGQKIVYPLSGNCVVFDKRRNCDEPQASFQKHDATVSAICASSSRHLLASGDKEGTIRVWDSQTCTEVSKLSDDRQHQITILSFSPDDAKLVSVSSKNNGQGQTICVWMTLTGNWKDAHLAFHTLAGHESVYFCHFIAMDENQLALVSGGSRHVHFWSEQHSTLAVSKGVLSQECANEAFVCGVSMGGKLVTGTESGSFVVWEENKVAKEIQAHNGSVLSLCACPEGLVSGCTKGLVLIWSEDLQKVASFDVAKSSQSPLLPAIGSIDISPHTNLRSTARILVRTECGDILEISVVTGNAILLVQGATSLDQDVSAAPNPTNSTEPS